MKILSEEELELKRKIVHAATAIGENTKKSSSGNYKISASTPISVRKSAKKSSAIASRKSVGNYLSSSNFLSINNDDNDEFYDVSGDGDDDDEINKSSNIAKQPQQQPQQSQNFSVNIGANDDDDDDDDDDITFRNPFNAQDIQAFLEVYPIVVRPFMYTYLIEPDEIDKTY
ncbi:hypothetical protein ABEB36_015779, partial [Hypothenemus hampei]